MNAKSIREMVMENEERVMEKSWKSHGKTSCQVCEKPDIANATGWRHVGVNTELNLYSNKYRYGT